MKQLTLALFISSLFVISACEDKSLSSKNIEMEKHITQLESDYKKSQEELANKENELNKIRDELNKISTTVPSLNVVIEPIFNKEEKIKFKKDAENEYARESSVVQVFASIPRTDIEWLDNLLLKEIANYKADENKELPEKLTKDDLVKQFQKMFDSLVQEAKEVQPIGLSSTLESYYIGQRHNIVSFLLTYSNYMGGAHGMHWSQYIHVDTNSQKVIYLNNLVEPQNQKNLKELLWNAYTATRSDPNDLFIEKKDFRISDSFYFSPEGIIFVYPPYELGSYAEGEVSIKLYWSEINPLLSSDYQQKEKDGMELMQTNF